MHLATCAHTKMYRLHKIHWELGVDKWNKLEDT